LGFALDGCLASDCPCVRPLPVDFPYRPKAAGPSAFGQADANPPDQVPPPWFDHLDGLLRTQGPGCIAIRCRTRFAAFHRRPIVAIASPAHASKLAYAGSPQLMGRLNQHLRRRTIQALTAAPRTAVHTPRRIPLVGSCAASLRPLPSCHYQVSSLRCANATYRRTKRQTVSAPPRRNRALLKPPVR
jgi:hypothetical protein